MKRTLPQVADIACLCSKIQSLTSMLVVVVKAEKPDIQVRDKILIELDGLYDEMLTLLQ